MGEMQDACIDAIVTDPPAGIGFMGREWDCDKGGREKWIKWLQGIAAEAYRLAKPGTHALVWALPRTSHWTATAWENAGWEVRDRVSHLFGSGFPKSLDVSKVIDRAVGVEREVVGLSTRHGGGVAFAEGHGGFNTEVGVVTAPATDAARQWQGWGTALKPAMEDWWLLRKPFKGSVSDNVLRYGTGALNIEGCRVAGLVPKTTQGQSASAGTIYGADQRNLREFEPHSQGRWPANLIHDGSNEVEEAFAAFGEKTSGRLSPKHNVRESTGWSGGSRADRVKQEFTENSGSASRFFYCAKASKADRDDGLEGLGIEDRNNHPTVKATALMRFLCRLITPPCGVILDPFTGSGSTGRGAVLEGFNFIGCELSPEYADIARRRIEVAVQGVACGDRRSISKKETLLPLFEALNGH
jgi:site-specific DNA-methyltransferase (adenine-specific)